MEGPGVWLSILHFIRVKYQGYSRYLNLKNFTESKKLLHSEIWKIHVFTLYEL